MRRLAIAAGLAAAALALAGCASSGDAGSAREASGTAATSWQPVTVDHAFGATEITEQPDAVVTLGWGSTEAALALGVVPVGIERQTFGVDDSGRLPWVTAALDEAGADPALLPATVEEPAYEDIDALNPDLILAPYSGITERQYQLLSQIAPTVVYPEEPWTTPWRDVIRIVGESVGRSDQAGALVDELDRTVADAAAAHPELRGRSVAAVWDVGGTFYVYKAADARVAFLLDLGLVEAPGTQALGAGSDSSFYFNLSYENTDQIDADLLVSFASTQAEADAFLAQSYARAIPAVQAGAVASVVGDDLIAAVSPPNALSLPWGLERYVEILAGAAARGAP